MDKEDVVYGYIYIYIYIYIYVYIPTHTHTHTHTTEYYLAIEKNEILPCATMWRELEDIMLSETNQSEKDIYHMTSLIGGI